MASRSPEHAASLWVVAGADRSPNLASQPVAPEQRTAKAHLAVGDKAPPRHRPGRSTREGQGDEHDIEAEVLEPPVQRGAATSLHDPNVRVGAPSEVRAVILVLKSTPPGENAVEQYAPRTVPVAVPLGVLATHPFGRLGFAELSRQRHVPRIPRFVQQRHHIRQRHRVQPNKLDPRTLRHHRCPFSSEGNARRRAQPNATRAHRMGHEDFRWSRGAPDEVMRAEAGDAAHNHPFQLP